MTGETIYTELRVPEEIDGEYKTHLMRLIVDLRSPTEVEVQHEGHRVITFNVHSLRAALDKLDAAVRRRDTVVESVSMDTTLSR